MKDRNEPAAADAFKAIVGSIDGSEPLPAGAPCRDDTRGEGLAIAKALIGPAAA